MSNIDLQALRNDSNFLEAVETEKDLEREIYKLLGAREFNLKLLKQIKTEVEKSYNDSRIATISGAVSSVTGSALAIVGFGVGFFTFGAGLALTIPGIALASAGGLLIACSELGYAVIAQAKLKDARNAYDNDRKQMMEVEVLANRLDRTLNTLAERYKSNIEDLYGLVRQIAKAITGVKYSYKTINALREATDIAIEAIKIGRVAAVPGRVAWRALTTFGRVFKVIGVIGDAVFIPIDLVIMAKAAHEVHKYNKEGKTNSVAAKDISELIKALEENESELKTFLSDQPA